MFRNSPTPTCWSPFNQQNRVHWWIERDHGHLSCLVNVQEVHFSPFATKTDLTGLELLHQQSLIRALPASPQCVWRASIQHEWWNWLLPDAFPCKEDAWQSAEECKSLFSRDMTHLTVMPIRCRRFISSRKLRIASDTNAQARMPIPVVLRRPIETSS